MTHESKLERCKLVTLDLDDTLWPSTPVLIAETHLYQWLQEHAPFLTAHWTIESLREQRMAWAQAHPQWLNDMGRTRRESLRELLVTYGYPSDMAEAAMRCFLRYRQQVEPYPDVLQVLQKLVGQVMLISLTNGNADVALTALNGLFQFNLNPLNTGSSKPMPGMFQRALELAHCTPAEAIHLGDDPLTDIEGARNLGITAVWINRDGRNWPSTIEIPAVTVTNLDDFYYWLTH